MKNIKKQIISIFILTLIILSLRTQESFAINQNFINVSINKENMKVRKIPLSLDGQKVDLETPAFIYIDRTLVPLRFISETYGGNILWDHASQTVSINHGSDHIHLTINSSDANVNGEIVPLDKSSTPKLVSFGGENAVTMVPLTFLSQYLDFDALWNEDTNSVHITNGRKDSEVNPNDGETVEWVFDQANKSREPINTIRSIQETNENGQQVLRIKGNAKTSKSIMKLGDGKQIVLDILDSKLDPSLKRNLYYDSNNISSLELSEFISTGDDGARDHIVRITCKVENQENLDPIELLEDGSDIILKENLTSQNEVQFKKSGDILEIKNLSNPKTDISYDRQGRVLELFLAKENKLKIGSQMINDDLIGEIDVQEEKDFYSLKIFMRSPISYSLLAEDKDSLSLRLSRAQSINKSDRLIVLDAGHGGHDGGAKPGKYTEKDITLAITLKTQAALENRGYNVHMIRDSDIFIDRFERAKIANGEFPDAFVSIHCNSVANNSVANGIETYYYVQGVSEDLKSKRKKLADSIQKSLIRKTGAVNRGIKTNSFTVIKNTNMPSVLVETGFLTHPREEELLNSTAYQDKIAQAIADGLDDYFNSI